MLRALRILAVNLLVFLAIFLGSMLLVSVGGDLWEVAKLSLGEGDKDERHTLPNYPDREYAAQIYEDYRKAKDGYFPILGWRKKPLSTRTVNIDAAGNRVHTIGRDNKPGAKSIGFFGASTTWGTGVDDNGTVPALFDEITDDYEVTNYGQNGYASRQHVAELVNLMQLGKAPDVVVFLASGFDTIVLCNPVFGDHANTTQETPKLYEMVENAGRKSYLFHNYVEPAIYTFRRVTGRQPYKAGEFHCDKDPDRAEMVARTMLGNWEIAHLLVTSYGGRFHVFLQPMANLGSPRTDYLKDDLSLPKHQQQKPVYERLNRLIAERGYDWYTELRHIFDGDERYYIDAVHVTRNGNQLLARKVAETLAAK